MSGEPPESRRTLAEEARASPTRVGGEVSSRQSRPSSRPVADSVEPAVLRYLAQRDRSEAQVRAFLVRAGASPVRIRGVIASLLRQGYLNDKAYALRWARTRLARQPMGRSRLEAELFNRGLDRTITANTVEQVYREWPERDLALRLLGQRSRSEKPGGRSSAAGLLRRQGFDEEMIEDLLGGSEPS